VGIEGKITLGVFGLVTALALYRKKLNMNVTDAVMNPNVRAFLMAIRHSEGTSGPNGYRTVFGGGLFTDMSDHPVTTGEWKGAKLSDAHCLGAGYSPGCITTAAGAYQFIRPTWRNLKVLLQLPDFSPESQDIAAVELIRQKGALDDVINGNIIAALNKTKSVWASLPGATYGQPTASLNSWLNVYNNSGGNRA
jgi:muramidase (phage lysozyme)